MALLKLYFYCLTALLAVNLILADNTNETEPQDRAGIFPTNFNPLNFFTQFLPFLNRQTRDVDNQENNDITESTSESSSEISSEAPTQRLTLGSALVVCNYTATPGLSCVGCNQALTCRPGNVGVQRRCLLYCNSGRCSVVPGSQCLNSTVAG